MSMRRTTTRHGGFWGPGLSMLLHGLALALLVALPISNALQGQHGNEVVISLEIAPPTPPDSPAKMEEKPQAEPEPAKPEPAIKPAPKPTPQAAKPKVRTEPKLETAPASSAPPQTVPTDEAGTAVQAPSPSVAAGQTGAEDAMRAYAQQLWAQILRHKPRNIRFQGTVQLSFRLSRSGALLDSGIARSSGMAALDRAAMEALTDAAPFPPPPTELPDERLSFVIPIAFE